jgi:hypothetical protein
MIVVPVLMTSCQVSEKLKIGPVINQTIIMAKAIMKAFDVPVACVAFCESRSSNSLNLFLFFRAIATSKLIT